MEPQSPSLDESAALPWGLFLFPAFILFPFHKNNNKLMRRHSMKQHRDAQGLFLGWGTMMEPGWDWDGDKRKRAACLNQGYVTENQVLWVFDIMKKQSFSPRNATLAENHHFCWHFPISVMFSDFFSWEVFIKLPLELAVSSFSAPTEKPDWCHQLQTFLQMATREELDQ